MAVFSKTEYRATSVRIDGVQVCGGCIVTVTVYSNSTTVEFNAFEGVEYDILCTVKTGVSTMRAQMAHNSKSIIEWDLVSGLRGSAVRNRPTLWLNR